MDRLSGMSARRVVPRAGRAVDRQPAAERLDAVGEAAQAGAAARVGAAGAVVGDLDQRAPPSARSTRTRTSVAPAYLATFVSASETT